MSARSWRPLRLGRPVGVHAAPLVTALTAIAVLGGCTSEPRALTSEELDLIREVGLADPVVVEAIASLDGPVDRFHGLSDEGDRVPVSGVTVEVDERRVPRAIVELRLRLAEQDVGVFHAEQRFGFEPDRLAVVVGADPYAFLANVRIDGINHDLEHEDVVARLREWDERFGLDYIGAGLDWVHANFVRMPDFDAFAAEVYAFCPDVVDQGTGSVAELASEMRRSRSLYCWWD